jgi:ABC-2 type transport system permease protein
VLYNPGLRNSWFIVTGTIGILMVMIGSLVASASMVNEKESGTIEQLLMTPAGSTEIIAAKVAPIMLLLSGDILLAVGVVRVVFELPVRGSLVLLYFAGMLCVLAGIGIGTFIATFTRSQTQAQLMSFFVNPPISMLSGATTPIGGMPYWMQQVSYLNPVRHFSTIARGVLLKGVGLEVLYPNLLALTAFTLVIVGASVWRFRKQLS